MSDRPETSERVETVSRTERVDPSPMFISLASGDLINVQHVRWIGRRNGCFELHYKTEGFNVVSSVCRDRPGDSTSSYDALQTFLQRHTLSSRSDE